MLKLSLEAIELVDAIARHGSFAGAAARLNKVPSTISYAVGKLEEQLGMLLFVRNGPRVTLTAAGEEMLKEGRWLLGAAGDLESRMRQIATGFESELRLVHDSLIPTQALIDDIRAFEALRCGTRLRIGCEALTGSWEALREGRADIVVAAGEGPAGGGYQAVMVGSLDFAFCVAPTHPLTRLGRPLQRGDLLECNAIVVSDSARTLSDRTVGLLAGQHHVAVPSMAAKIACQAAGLGHGFLPRACIEGDLKRGTLVELQTEEPRAPEAFWLAWKTGAKGKALQWWVKQLNRQLVPALLPRSA
ncbi:MULTISPECIES: LysR family transcriptional regulator [Variovorax]|uniref:DNA-binding transcriptional LysR family regulator n=1 Tax=Variovorax paradoxus TaxID=34073 RepID=A0AAW8EIU3_VARPD|nr:LysR family transcriptional regulator [Variovorax paradoxus]MBW8715764.1 LysR family transcriptional regulator [Variovorax paradoxus]MBW8891238.1 LysR family transcriptional regulator [Burkholderiales bacterium]MDP9972370.1 DNA-binding transcriptional LysR family regulator [Variovorax paradoxus]